MIEILIGDDEIAALGFEDPLFAMSFAEWGSRVKPLLLERGAPPAYTKIGRRAFELFYDEKDHMNLFKFREDGRAMNENPEAAASRNAAILRAQSLKLSQIKPKKRK